MPAPNRRRYSPRRSREERREQALDAALRVLDDRGFAGFSIEAVAREVDLAKTVIYDAIGNQEELLRALIVREQDRALSDVAEAIPRPPFGPPDELIADGITRVLDAVRDHPATWRLILLPPEGTPPAVREEVDGHRARLNDQLVPIVAWGLKEIGTGDLDAEMATLALLSNVENAIRLTITEPDRYPVERFAAFGRSIVRKLAT